MTLYPIDKRIGVHNSTKQRCETYHDIVEKSHFVGDNILACKRGGGDCGGYTSLDVNETYNQI